MKPVDHPEFFRFPAPEGLSRESKIALSKAGEFTHEGAPVEKRSLADAMHTWLSYHPDDGRPILENGFDWCYLSVEDTAHFVVAVRGQPPDVPRVVLRSGHEEPLRTETLRVDADGIAFVDVLPRGAKQPVPARFLREAQLALAPWLEDEPLGLRVGGAVIPVGERVGTT